MDRQPDLFLDLSVTLDGVPCKVVAVLPEAATVQLPELPERAKRDEVLDSLDRRRADYLERIRTGMRQLLLARQELVARFGCWARDGVAESVAFVTADDARRLFESWNPDGSINRNFLGAVFRGGWRALPGRRVQSATTGSHAREIKCWHLSPTTRSSYER